MDEAVQESKFQECKQHVVAETPMTDQAQAISPRHTDEVSRSMSFARHCRELVVMMCHEASASHVASSLSVVDILSVLYSGVVRADPLLPEDPSRDLVVMSKGHAAAGLYSALSLTGFFPTDALRTFTRRDSILSGHVTAGNIPGVEFSTGSLGHGLPFGVGAALGLRLKGFDSRVFVVMSDGECDEGSTWEAALFAAHHKLSNLTVLIDRNGLQSLTTTEKTLALEPLADKWKAFNWLPETVDGHDHVALWNSLSQSGRADGPTVMICNTTKGKGVSFMEGRVDWHYLAPNALDYEKAIAEIRGCNGA